MSSTGSPNMSLPVLIISFNNHEFAANTVAQLERFGIEDIVVVDNASDREETRAWLDSLRHRVIRNAGNYGHLCWARPEIYDTLPDRFCVTDPDLQFHPALPADFLSVLCELSERHGAMKVGFALDLSDADGMFQYPDYHLGQSITQWEAKFWHHRMEAESLEVYRAEVDTTFHVFNKLGDPKVQLRVAGCYTAKHLPWYLENPVIPREGMTALYRNASRVSTIARFHLRHEQELRAAVDVNLYQIAYSEATRDALEPGYRMLDNLENPRPDWYEYWPIRNFLLNEALDENAFYGFFSPKFGEKTQLTHAQVTEFVRSAAADHDVVLFSPQPDMGAFFLNVFEQAETFDAGFIEAMDGFLKSIGRATDLRSMVMDSSRTVFSNYFVARPAFWREWLRLTELFFALCEGPDSVLKARCTAATSYGGGVQRKVFILERLASLLLSTQPRWRVKAANPFGFGWSMTRFRQHPHEAIVSDALKTAYLKQGFPEYLRAFGEIRSRFAAAGKAA